MGKRALSLLPLSLSSASVHRQSDPSPVPRTNGHSQAEKGPHFPEMAFVPVQHGSWDESQWACVCDFGMDVSGGHPRPWVWWRTWQRLRKVCMASGRALEPQEAKKLTEPWPSQILNLPNNSIKKKKKKRLPVTIILWNKEFQRSQTDITLE